MIRCPSCDTLNPDGRESCSNCGATLPQASTPCPRCGTANPVGNLFCDRCNTRLPLSGGVIPSDFPSASDEPADNALVKGISLPARNLDEAGDAPIGEQVDLPDWLRGLAEESEGRSDTAEATGDDTGDADWLAGLLPESSEIEIADAEEDEGLSFEPDALPDWFTSEAGSDETGGDETVIDSLTDLPDWLAATADAADAPEPAAPVDLPDWLATTAEDNVGETPAAADLPDWLLGSAEMGADAVVHGPTAAEEEAETPDWYEAVSDALQPPGETVDESAEASAEPGIFSESELPDWLAEGEEPATGGDVKPAAEDLPDWLADVDAEEDDDLALPDWLQSVPSGESAGSDEGSAPEDVVGSDDLAESLDAAIVEGDAAALADERALDAATAPEPADIPDWLTGLAEAEPVPGGSPEGLLLEQPTPLDYETKPSDGPGWMDGIELAAETAPSEPAAPAFVPPASDDQDEPVTADELEEPEETPAWLAGFDAVATTPQSLDAPGLFEGDSPARAELPSWLQNLRPQTSPAINGEIDVAGASGDLAGAEIPEWLQALRPAAGEPGEAPTRRVSLPTPAEPEGPLQGIPGVLQPLSGIDAPAEIKPTMDVSIPEPVTAQAQLWQSLLEQPRSAERVVAHGQPRGRAGTAIVRVLVAAILMIGILVVSLTLPEMAPLAVEQRIVAPGAPAMLTHLSGVQAGDRVVVAVEYSAAFAEEMTQIAAPLLEHLATQQADVTLVSSLPEGVVLGALLASDAGLAQPATAYLAGNAAGIAAYLADPQAPRPTSVLVLSSQPERLRWWIEQIDLVNEGASPDISLGIGLSASTGPVSAPYYTTSQVQGWMIGIPDALAYGELRGVTDTAAARELDILMMAHWAAAVLLIIGLPVSLLAGKKGGR